MTELLCFLARLTVQNPSAALGPKPWGSSTAIMKIPAIGVTGPLSRELGRLYTLRELQTDVEALRRLGLVGYSLQRRGNMGLELEYYFYASDAFVLLPHPVRYEYKPALHGPSVAPRPLGLRQLKPRVRRSKDAVGPSPGKDPAYDGLMLVFAGVLKNRLSVVMDHGDKEQRTRFWRVSKFLETSESSISDYTVWLSYWLGGSSRGWLDKVLPFLKGQRGVAGTALSSFMQYGTRLKELDEDVRICFHTLLANESFTDPQSFGYPSGFDFPVQSIKAALQVASADTVRMRVQDYHGGGLRQWLGYLASSPGESNGRSGWA